MKKFLPLFILILLVACFYVIFFWQPQSEEKRHTMMNSQSQAVGGDFTLLSTTGTLSLKQLRGKVVLIYFGYTWCPDICPTNLSMMANAFSQIEQADNPYGLSLEQVQGIFISVDPQRDTMARLAEYAPYFHPNIIGASSTPEVIKELADRYGASYKKVIQDSATNYVVDHSSETYVVDPEGRLVTRLPHAAPPADILAAIKQYAVKPN